MEQSVTDNQLRTFIMYFMAPDTIISTLVKPPPLPDQYSEAIVSIQYSKAAAKLTLECIMKKSPKKND